MYFNSIQVKLISRGKHKLLSDLLVYEDRSGKFEFTGGFGKKHLPLNFMLKLTYIRIREHQPTGMIPQLKRQELNLKKHGIPLPNSDFRFLNIESRYFKHIWTFFHNLDALALGILFVN